MLVIGKKNLTQFQKKHSDCKKQINEWINEIEAAEWNNFADIKKRYPKASILDDNKVIFDIKGNHYRIITIVKITFNRVIVCEVLTHAEYDKKQF